MSCPGLLETLRQRGYRLTPQRAVIIRALAHTAGHSTVEGIYAQTREHSPFINIATVYRTLDMLVEEGLACRSDLRDGQAVYTSAQHGPHIHLVCRQCGGMLDAGHELVAPLIDELRAHYGFEADALHISIPGLCQACRKNGID